MDGGPPPGRGARAALIVATAEYQDPGLRALRGAAADAAALQQVLADPAVGGFEVVTVLDRPAHEVAEEVEGFFAGRLPGDLLLVHLSGHGIKNQAGELHFAMATTKLDRLAATSVSAEFLNRQMGASRARSIILCLDCCYAGAFDRGMVPRADESVDVGGRFSGQGRAVITASGALEYAFEGGELTDDRPQPSVFTSAMVEGLATGAADRDRDGWVGLGELYEYVHDAVRAANPHQTPGMWAFGIQGNLVVARSSNDPTVPEVALEAPAGAAVRSAAATPAVRTTPSRRLVPRNQAVLAAVVAVLAAAFAVLVVLVVPALRGNDDSPVDAVPAGFEGRWEGDADVRNGGTAQLTITLTEGATNVHVDSTGDGGSECLEGDLTFGSGTKSQIETTFAPGNTDCATADVTMRLDGDKVRYYFVGKVSDGGFPTSAVLSRRTAS